MSSAPDHPKCLHKFSLHSLMAFGIVRCTLSGQFYPVVHACICISPRHPIDTSTPPSLSFSSPSSLIDPAQWLYTTSFVAMLRLLLLLSLPVVFFAFSVSLETLQQYLPSLPFVADKPTIYCYGSITTLDSTSREFTPGCLSVNSDGTFNSPFSATEPQILRRGWPVNLSKHVIPGLWDGHAHLFQYGEMLGTVKVYNTHSIPEILEQICDYHMQHPTSGTKGNWIKGNGWDQSLLPDGMPMASDLPESLYVLLYRVDVHCIWVSRAVLDLLGDEPPVSPPGGSIPSPGVFCDDAMDLVLPFVPSPTREEKRLFVKTAQKSLHSYGIVGMHDAGVVVDDRELYVEMAEKGELKLRVYAMIQCRALNTFCPEEAEMVKREDGMVTVASVKLFAGEYPTRRG